MIKNKMDKILGRITLIKIYLIKSNNNIYVNLMKRNGISIRTIDIVKQIINDFILPYFYENIYKIPSDSVLSIYIKNDRIEYCFNENFIQKCNTPKFYSILNFLQDNINKEATQIYTMEKIRGDSL